MFWNKKQTEKITLDSAMVELGREIERGLLLLGALVQQHWIIEENDYAKAVSVTMDMILQDKTLTNEDRLEKAKHILDWSKVYRKFIDSSSSKYGDFILTRLNQFEEMLNSSPKTGSHDKVEEWTKLTRDLCKIRASEITAIEAHIETDDFIPKLVIRDGGNSEQNITEEEKNQFAHLAATYGSKRKLAYDAEKKIEPMRSNLAESMFGKLNDYMKGGSYSRLLVTKQEINANDSAN